MTGSVRDSAEQRAAENNRRFFNTSLGLVAGKVVSLGTGFLFWLLAARTADVQAVGLAAGAVSLMMLSTQFAVAGTGSSFILNHRRHREVVARLLDTSITIVLLLSTSAALIALLAMGLALDALRAVASDPTFAVLFVAMSMLGTLGILLDHVSVALGRGEQVLVRNIVGGLFTAAPLLVLPQFDIHPEAEHLFAMWVLGGGANCVVAAVQLSRALDGYRYRPALPVRLVRTVVRTGLPNHALTLVERAPNLLLPVIVTELLSPELNAYWYVAWMMAWAVLVIPVSIGVTLLAKISSGDDSLRSDIFHATRVGVGVGACGAVALALLAQPILSLLGSDYQAYSAAPLRILLLALLPVLVLQVYYSVCRSRGRLPEALLTGMLTGGIGLVATALVATNRGLDGIAWAWMATQLAAGIWAAFRLAALVPTRAEESQPPAGGLAISQPVV